MSVIPATQEAEAEELLEPRRWRLQQAEIVCHCTPAWETRANLRLKKKKKDNEAPVVHSLTGGETAEIVLNQGYRDNTDNENDIC